MRTEQPEIIFLCTPANPTGAMIRQADLSKILDYCKKHGILLVLDECFVEFLMRSEAAAVFREFLDWETGRPEHGGSLFLLRAFTKTYAMAGLRLGYGFCTSRELLERMGGELAALECFDPGAGSGICGTFGRTDSFFEKDAGDGGERTAVSF